MKIQGANLGEKEVEYKLLSKFPFFSDQRQEIVKRLEQLYLKLIEESKKTDITPFPEKEGKVLIKEGMINHRCSNSLESLEAISRYGILASEWFGQIESEQEGVFCAFVDRIHDENNLDERNQNRARTLNLQRLKSMSDDVVIFFDSKHPVMKKLLHLDYFEYAKIKQLTSEKLTEIYSEEEIELISSIIEPFSPAGRNFHTKGILPYCDWSAIPGGIPSTLINGICIKNHSYNKEYIEKIKELFPKATIFNGNLEIIHAPEREEKKNDFLESLKVSTEELTQNIQQSKHSNEVPIKSSSKVKSGRND